LTTENIPKENSKNTIIFINDNVKLSKVLTSWTIKTEVSGRGTVHDHSNDEALRKTWMQSFSVIYHRWKRILIGFVLLIISSIILLFAYVHWRSVKNDSMKFKILDQILNTRDNNPLSSSSSLSSSSFSSRFNSSHNNASSSTTNNNVRSSIKSNSRYSRVPITESGNDRYQSRYTRSARSFQL